MAQSYDDKLRAKAATYYERHQEFQKADDFAKVAIRARDEARVRLENVESQLKDCVGKNIPRRVFSTKDHTRVIVVQHHEFDSGGVHIEVKVETVL